MTNAGGASVALAASRAAERRVLRALQDQGATGPDRAAPLVVRAPSGAALRRLVRARVVVEAGEGRYWVDADRLDAWRIERRSRVMLVLLAVLTAVAIVLAIAWARGAG